MSWENEPHYLGAFKMNLPGQYEYQRRIFSQFMQGVEDNAPYGFILAGDDVSWTGGWAEGAVTTAINAVPQGRRPVRRRQPDRQSRPDRCLG